MLPSLLPPRSPPSGVSSCPSRAASSGLTASAGKTPSTPSSATAHGARRNRKRPNRCCMAAIMLPSPPTASAQGWWQMGTFAGKTVLITGASEGIGRALALALAGERAQLVLNARTAARLTELAAECTSLGAAVETVPGDVARAEDCREFVARAAARFGGVDYLVNNAGITMWARLDAVSDLSVFERLLQVNYLGAVYATAAALPFLKDSGGLIVAVAS